MNEMTKYYNYNLNIDIYQLVPNSFSFIDLGSTAQSI